MLMAFPYILLALAIVAVLGPGLLNALYAIAVVNIPFFARNIRGIIARRLARANSSTRRVSPASPMPQILFIEVLPNVLPVIVITMSTTVGWMILETAGLSFLGLGAQPPQADLGSMLGDGRKILFTAPHVSIIPGLMIFALVMSINLLGDGVRDVLDPRLKSGALTRPVARTAVDARRAARRCGDRTGAGARRARPAHRIPHRRRGLQGGRRRRPPREAGRVPRHRRRIRLRQVGHRHVDHGAGADAARPHRRRRRHARRRGPALPPPTSASGSCAARRVSHVFQDPLSTLHPLFTVGDQLVEAIQAHQPLSQGRGVGQRPPTCSSWSASPIPPSGSTPIRTNCRAACASASASPWRSPTMPDIIIADEPTTALDVTVQAQVLSLLDALRRERDTGDPVHHPRFRRRLGNLRPGRGHVCRQVRRDRQHRRDPVRAGASLYRQADRLRAGARPARTAARRDRRAGRRWSTGCRSAAPSPSAARASRPTAARRRSR